MKTGPVEICLALALTLCVTVGGQEKTVTTANEAVAPAPPPTPTAGLVNDWLREQSSQFNVWDLGAQVRLRYEVKENGGSFPPEFDFRRTGVENDNSDLVLREKFHLGYSPCTWFSIYAEGRDSSSVGDDRHPSPDTDHIDLYQAFLRLGDPAQFPLTAKIGRQELIYADERLVGNADWANVPRSFDVAKLRFQNANFWVDAFSGFVVVPVPNEFNKPNHHDLFSGIYAGTSTLIPKQETQLYFLSRNTDTKAMDVPGSLYILPTARDIYTVGARAKSLPDLWNGWDYTAELAGQLGSINLPVPGAGLRRLDHEALAASVAGGYTWAEAFGTPRVGLEYNFASGDSDPRDGKNGTFENLFPTNHKLYGYMDFLGWRNMHNPRLNLAFKPARGLSLTVDYHLFWLADTHDFFYPETGLGRGVTGPAKPGEPISYGRNPQFSSFVGSEIDLEAIYALKPWVTLRAGYGHFFVGDYIRSSLANVGGATDADWVYIQTTFTF